MSFLCVRNMVIPFLLLNGLVQTHANSAAPAGGVDFMAWDRVMTKSVRRGAQLGIPINIVDYISIATDPDFETFTKSLAAADPSQLTPNESFAIGINMYNAYAIKTLIDYACKYEDNLNQMGKCSGPVYGLPDVQFKIGSSAIAGFDLKYHVFAGKNYSLNDIEGMMRPIPSKPLFNQKNIREDLRVHATLVCDGTSCPDLASKAYQPETIDAQMDAAVTGWMANPWKGLRIDRSNNTVYFSRIMSWFELEFAAQGGVVKAYAKFFPAKATEFFASTTSYTHAYFEYIWDANGPVPCSCMPDVDDETIQLPDCHLKP
eukprot:m.160697 g.160697  ORF g.160697 m.160697 type:complete len:317 (+) comp31196_c2_seq1:277-1227(+)